MKLHRTIRLFLLATLTFLLVSACARNGSHNTVSHSLQPSPSECRIVKHANGETCVPYHPQRVVVLDTSPLDAVLALGVKPVGSPELTTFKSYPAAQISGIEIVGDETQPNLEKILLLKPDLILTTRYAPKIIYDKLSQIAPAVMAPSGDVAWKDDLIIYAEALGKTEAAEQLLNDYQKRIKEFQFQMGDRLKHTKVSVVVAVSQYVRIYLQDSFLSSVIRDTGLPRPPAQEQEGLAKEISLETLSIADGDVMFVMVANSKDSALREVQRHLLWSQLNAVRQGRVYAVNYDTWIAQRNIGGANRILNDLFKYLVEESR